VRQPARGFFRGRNLRVQIAANGIIFTMQRALSFDSGPMSVEPATANGIDTAKRERREREGERRALRALGEAHAPLTASVTTAAGRERGTRRATPVVRSFVTRQADHLDERAVNP